MKLFRKTLLAFLIASLVPPIFGLFTSSIFPGSLISQVVTAFLLFYPFTLVALLSLGVPAFFILDRLNWVNLWPALAVGTCSGVVVACVINFPSLVSIKELFTMCFLGLLTATVFWGAFAMQNLAHNKANQTGTH